MNEQRETWLIDRIIELQEIVIGFMEEKELMLNMEIDDLHDDILKIEMDNWVISKKGDDDE